MDNDDLDRVVNEILQRERKTNASPDSRHKTDSDTMLVKALGRAYAKADRVHRLATERVEIKTFKVTD